MYTTNMKLKQLSLSKLHQKTALTLSTSKHFGFKTALQRFLWDTWNRSLKANLFNVKTSIANLEECSALLAYSKLIDF